MTPKCSQCDMSVVYALSGQRLKCLNCGHIWPVATSQWLDVKYKELHREPLNRPTTTSQDDFTAREDGKRTIKQIIGKKWNCDPEAVAGRIWNKLFKGEGRKK